ncbi:hypothetical protein FRC03_007855 [Tulasnella sp. 419]|nr:hypothetical protein FRC03_007855 [Tulasnella sp. 419]
MACLSTETADKALSLLLADTRIPETVIYDIEEPKHILAREAERLEKVASAFQDHVRRRVSFIHRQQNSLIPLYRLPDELLVEIFNISRREPLVWGFNKYRVLLRLAAVSSRWRTVALSFPGLWDNLSNRLSIEATALMLDRSRQAPLKLSCLFQNDRCAHWFFKLTLPQMTRWKSLEMDSRCLNRNTSDILTGELHLPRLEDLVIYNPSDGDFEVPLNISAPSLQTLSSQYYQFPLRLEPGLHSKLVKLNFLACWDGIPFFPEHYYTLLSSATNLEEVSIHGYNSDSYPKPDIHNFMEIHLPKLKRLHLNELPFRTIGFLLSSISTPSDCYPNIKISGKSLALGTRSRETRHRRSNFPHNQYEN